MRRVVCPLKLSQNVTLVLPTPFLSLLVRKMATVVYAQYGHPGSDEEGVIFEFNENDTHQTDSEDELTLVRGPASKHKRRASPRAPALPAATGADAAPGGRKRLSKKELEWIRTAVIELVEENFNPRSLKISPDQVATLQEEFSNFDFGDGRHPQFALLVTKDAVKRVYDNERKRRFPGIADVQVDGGDGQPIAKVCPLLFNFLYAFPPTPPH